MTDVVRVQVVAQEGGEGDGGAGCKQHTDRQVDTDRQTGRHRQIDTDRHGGERGDITLTGFRWWPR